MGSYASTPTKSEVELQLSLEILKYENQLLKREVQEKDRKLKQHQSKSESNIELKFEDITDEPADTKVHELIKQKYFECETYKKRLDDIMQHTRSYQNLPRPRFRKLIPVLEPTDLSNNMNFSDMDWSWSPIGSCEFLQLDEGETNQTVVASTQ